MALAETLTARDARGRGNPNDDSLGFDRPARAFLRSLHRLGPGAVGQVAGGPGSGRTEFMRRCAHAIEHDRDVLAAGAGVEFQPSSVWYNPWTYGKQGHPIAGLIAAIARPSGPGQVLERARDLTNTLIRMRFDGCTADGLGAAFNPGEADPVEKVRRGFVTLVEQVKGQHRGRLAVFVTDLDQLSPLSRFAFLDGLRVLVGSGADLTVILALGRDAALGAVRARDGVVADRTGDRLIGEMIDLTVNVPRVDIRRSGALLRRYLGQGEVSVRRAFGDEALGQLAEAVAWQGLGRPRAVERLAARVDMFAEFVLEGRHTVRLKSGQWAWLVVAEYWGDFRRFVTQGGRARWNELRDVLVARANDELRPDGSEVEGWLERDPDLCEFLSLHVEAFARDADGLLWMDTTMAAAGI